MNINRYTTEQSLKAHIKFVHDKDGEPKGVVCEFCGKQLISRASLLNHIQRVHRTESGFSEPNAPLEKFECTICNASFTNKYRLKHHTASLHFAKPVKCSLCDKISPNPAALVILIENIIRNL